MKKIILGFLWILSGVVIQARAEEPAYQFSREIKSEPRQQEELLSVTLDTDIYSSTQESFPDLRLLDQSGKPISYLLQKVQTTRSKTVSKYWQGRKPSVRPLEDGGLEITLKLDEKDPRPNGLRILSPLQNYEQRVRISTSANGMEWDPAGEEAVIFDYARYMDVTSEEIAFPETDRRYFRILIDNVTAEQESELMELTRRLRGNQETDRSERVQIKRRPFRINRIEFRSEEKQERVTGNQTRDYPITDLKIEQDEEEQQTIITVKSQREPITSLMLETSDRNFSRQAVVQVEETRGINNNWKEIGSRTLSRIDFKTLSKEKLSIPIPESQRSEYRIVINNRDSTPLDVTGIKAEGNVYELVFLAAPGQEYRLVYASDEAEPANYDTAAIRALLKEGFKPTATELGTAVTNADFGQPPAFKPSELLSHPILLVGVIALLIAVLSWGLYHAVRRMDDLSGE